MSSYRSAFKRKFDATKDAANITTGLLNTARVPSLDASKIASGTLNLARIPAIDATRVPNLDASKITSGLLGLLRIPVLDAARIPSLDAGKITSGTLNLARIPSIDAARVPSLDASKITTGLLNAARVPSPTTAEVAAAMAGITVGGVGSVALMYVTSIAQRSAGTSIAGSSLRWANAATADAETLAGAQNVAPSGTWKLLGNTGYQVVTGTYGTLSRERTQISVFLRVA